MASPDENTSWTRFFANVKVDSAVIRSDEDMKTENN